MFVKKLIKITFGSIAYPFINLPSLLVPYLVTLALYVAIGYVALTYDVEALTKGVGELSLAMVLLNIILVLLAFLAVIPILASVTRHLVLSEKINMAILGRILRAREFGILIAWLKVVFVYILPLAIAGLAMFYLGDLMDKIVPTFGLNFHVTLGEVLISIGFLLGLYFFIRGSMAPITGALDRGVSIRNSFKVTRGHGLSIFLDLLALIALMGLVMWLVLHFTGMSAAVLDVNTLVTLPTREKLILVAEVASLRLLAAIIFVAALSKIYVVISSKG